MHYVNDPIVPLSKTAAMINLDMVGRLRDDALTINSVGTGTGFRELLDQLNRPYGFHLTQVPGALGRSDQASFYAKRIPDIHFFTGKHPEYHRPTDTFEKVNLPGMRRIAAYVYDVTVALADAPQRPKFVAVPMQRRAGEAALPFLGCVPDFTREEPGYPISAVIAGSPADRCGLRGGDVVVKFGAAPHRHLRRFRRRLAAVCRRRPRQGPRPPQQRDDDFRGHAGRAGITTLECDGLPSLFKTQRKKTGPAVSSWTPCSTPRVNGPVV